MPLLIVIGNVLQRNVNTESIVEKTIHKLVKYRWDERANSEFLDNINSNINKYFMYGINFLQKGRINDALNILHFLVKRDRANMRCTGEKKDGALLRRKMYGEKE
jgi:hypothetical protein